VVGCGRGCGPIPIKPACLSSYSVFLYISEVEGHLADYSIFSTQIDSYIHLCKKHRWI
jgi:hypothetical protein